MAARKPIDAADEYLGASRQFNIDEIGSGHADIEVVDRVLSSDKAEQEKFMNEVVTVMVHESTDQNDAELVQVGINGRTQFFKRGVPQDVRRCYLERLARSKKTSYSQNLDHILGEQMNNMRSHNALKYPFSVLEDRNPKGSAWLRGILAERT